MIKKEITAKEANIIGACSKNIRQFCKYTKILTEEGTSTFKPYKFQKELLDKWISTMEEKQHMGKRNHLVKTVRQCGITTALAVYALWYAIFNPDKCVGILAPKEAQSCEILYRIKDIYNNLPDFLKPETLINNKRVIRFENKTQIFACAAHSTSIRGKSVDLMIIDDFAHMSDNLAEDFMMCVFPTQASRAYAQMIIVSTPTTKSHPFYKIYEKASNKMNSFNITDIPWNCIKRRNAEWKKRIIRECGIDFFNSEFSGKFKED